MPFIPDAKADPLLEKEVCWMRQDWVIEKLNSHVPQNMSKHVSMGQWGLSLDVRTSIVFSFQLCETSLGICGQRWQHRGYRPCQIRGCP